MARRLPRLAALGAGFTLLAACEAQPPSEEAPAPEARIAESADQARQAILRLEREWTAALSAKDLAWYERHVAPEYRTIISSGRVVPRPQVIAHVRNSPPAKDLRIEQAEVRVHGDTAVALVTQSFTLASGKRQRLRITDVWRRSDEGRWMAVHSHETPVASTSSPRT